jgi:hypothetical protein
MIYRNMVAALAVLAGCVAATTDYPHCDKIKQCEPDLEDNKGKLHSYDFSKLCDSKKDLVYNDNAGHTYHVQICGYAHQECLPDDTHDRKYGVAVQSWGDAPDPPTQCNDPDNVGSTIPCTKPCEILGYMEPQYRLVDSSNPKTGGVIATFKGDPALDRWSTACPIDPTQQVPIHKVHYQFSCNRDAKTPKITNIAENATELCHYTVFLDSEAACEHHGLSGGAVFAILLFVGVALYIGVGMGVTYAREGIVAFPNRHFWTGLGSNIKAQFNKLTGKGSATGATGAYDTIGGDGSGVGTGGGSKGASTSAYTDL